MINQEFYYRKEIMSKKRLKKFAIRKKDTRMCSSHGIVGAHIVDKNGQFPKDSDLDFKYLRSRDDYNKMKEYNRLNNNEYRVCTACNSNNNQDDSEYFTKKSKRHKENNKCYQDGVIFSKSKKEKLKGETDENCPICLESMKGRLIKKFGCSHSICVSCFDSFSEFKTESKKISFSINGLEFSVDMLTSNHGEISNKYHGIFSQKKKLINYTVKCPLCRTSIYNNNDETIVC